MPVKLNGTLLPKPDSGPDDPNKHWRGMPEFHQPKSEPYAKMTIRFETKADMEEFSALIGQKLTRKTKSLWHPYKPHKLPEKKVWVADE